jgi:septal ring factor EnvC (AmiA/AmiB activator)
MTTTPVSQPTLIEDLRRSVTSLTHQYEHLNAHSHTLYKENTSLDARLKDATTERDAIKDALAHVFPYAIYREKRPDLASLSDKQLIDHFVAHGINEGVNLKASLLSDELEGLRAQKAEDAARISLLKEKTRHTTEQLDLLKDLFIRANTKP